MGSNFLFTGMGVFGIFFTVTFLMVIAVFTVVLVKIIGRWNKNNRAPRLTVPAVVVTKRSSISHSHHSRMHTTSHYVTFEVESGDRMELYVTGQEFGLLVEGDRGMLTFQGTRYLDFQRN